MMTIDVPASAARAKAACRRPTVRRRLNSAKYVFSAIDLIASASSVPSAYRSAGAIANIATQFAGQLAFNEVLASSTTVPVTEGVVSVSQDQQTLAVDFSDQLWSVGTDGTTAPDDIVGRKDLTDIVFKQTGGIFEGTPLNPTPANDIRAGMKWLWNDDNSSIIDRFVFATKDGPLTTTLPDRSVQGSTKVSLFAAGGSDESAADCECRTETDRRARLRPGPHAGRQAGARSYRLVDQPYGRRPRDPDRREDGRDRAVPL